MMRANKDHRVLAVKEFLDKDYEDVLKRPAFCSEPRHEKEELRFFCKNCKLAVCQTCINLGLTVFRETKRNETKRNETK